MKSNIKKNSRFSAPRIKNRRCQNSSATRYNCYRQIYLHKGFCHKTSIDLCTYIDSYIIWSLSWVWDQSLESSWCSSIRWAKFNKCFWHCLWAVPCYSSTLRLSWICMHELTDDNNVKQRPYYVYKWDEKYNGTVWLSFQNS